MSELRWEARTSQVRTRGQEEPRPASRYLGPQLFGCPGFEEQSLPRMLRGPEREGPAGEMQGLEWAAGPQPQSHPRAGWTVALNIRGTVSMSATFTLNRAVGGAQNSSTRAGPFPHRGRQQGTTSPGGRSTPT